MKEAEKYHVLPIDDRVIEHTNAALAGRPDIMAGRMSLTLYDGMNGMLQNTFITADVGLDNQTPVAAGIGIGRDETRFNGEIKKIIVETK